MKEIDRLCSLPNAKLEIGQKPLKKYNKAKFNRMGHNDGQAEYLKACQTMVTDYRISTGEIFYSITKKEYEYAKTILWYAAKFPDKGESIE